MTQIIAHRGFSGLYPENTMLAFQKAVELGVDGIELDVHLSRDGEVVIAHDETLRRVAGMNQSIAELSARELAQVEVHGGEMGLCERGVPTLRAYLAYIQDKAVFTNIELKTGAIRYAGIEEKTMALIDEFGLRSRVLFSSFNHRSLTEIHRIAPEMGCACLVMCHLERAGAYARERGFSWVNPHYTFMNEETLAELNAEGVGAQVWTVDDEARARWLCEHDVYAIITNRPDVALRVRKEVQGR